MLQTVLDLGILRIYGYGLMLVCGFISGIYLARWRARRAGEDPDNITQCGILALVGGVVGARVAFIIENYADFAESESTLVMLGRMANVTSGGLIYYGGVVLAVGLVLAYLRFKHLPIRRYLDMLAASMMIGLAFGRAGCLVNGCCWGTRCSEHWPLAMTFPMFSKPLYKIGDGAGPFSTSTDAPSAVYNSQLVARAVHQGENKNDPDLARRTVEGHINPDARLVHQFITNRMRIDTGDKEVEVQSLLLHPPRYLHGRLKSDQLATMFAARDQASAMFEATAGEDGRLSKEEWRKALESGEGFLRGSEHWDEAISFDQNRDGLVSFDEGWEYLQERRTRLARMFPAPAPATAPATGAGSTTGPRGIDVAGANAYLQEDLFALAGRSWSLPVKPAQIIGIINALLLAGLLIFFHRLRKREGQVFALMLVLYPITRFLLEMLRSHGEYGLGRTILSHNQYTSLVVAVTGIIFWCILRKLPGPIAD